tara:strand:- start:10366 stop:10596 length:231 start_codon:yes stop_codon:yes gene_type:complete
MKPNKVEVSPKSPPRSYLCYFCQKPAPYGIGYGGLRELIPNNRNGRLWVCSDHVKEAELRRDKARLEDNPLLRRSA